MDDISLIPFGLLKADDVLVEVSEVERGEKCGCICPSCKTLLIARHGKVNEWHFAHVSKGSKATTTKDCEYSFEMSVRLLASQVLAEITYIKTPALTMFLRNGQEVGVTKPRRVEIEGIQLDKKVEGLQVHAFLSVGRHGIAVIFNQSASHVLAIPDQSKQHFSNIGILEISLEGVDHSFFGNNSNGGHKEKLRRYIIEDLDCKKWLYHPKTSRLEIENGQELFGSNIHYCCLFCSSVWAGDRFCSTCDTDRYVKEGTFEELTKLK